MPTVITRGAASAQGYGYAGVKKAANYIEDVFSTYLYTGNGSTQTITNGIDLSGKGGLVWIKSRNDTTNHFVFDTSRGATKEINSNTTDAEATLANSLTAFTTNGFTVGGATGIGTNNNTYVSWTFRKQAKFFDVVTYTGNGTARTIAHNLGSVPGCIIIKRTSSPAYDWTVYHRSLGNSKYVNLNQTWGEQTSPSNIWNNADPTSSVFSVGTQNEINGSGATYVAYLFAHDAGGFGASGSDNVISCGSWTDSGSGTQTITLGYEPQWLIYKRSDGVNNWVVLDNMRGWPVVNAAGSTANLYPNLSNAESAGNYGGNGPTATGFNMPSFGGGTYIYIAIRRGPMKTPTSGTSVYYPQAISQAATIDSTNVPFPPDFVNTFSRNGTDRATTAAWNLFNITDRLRGLGAPNNTYSASGPGLISSSTAAENTTGYVQLKADGQNITRGGGWNDPQYGNFIYYFLRRAPGFFDVVCYTGTGANRTVSHNLGVAPEFIQVKCRSNANGWMGYSAPTGNTKYINFGDVDSAQTLSTAWNNTSPTSSVFTVGTDNSVNGSARTYVAYLFATVAGVSKVGSYTGTGTTKQIDCGFTGGARFVLIKRTDSTGDWYVWDSARGIVAGNDPYLLLNSAAVEVTNTDYIDTYSAGFEISSTAPAAINANGGSFIFLAIA